MRLKLSIWLRFLRCRSNLWRRSLRYWKWSSLRVTFDSLLHMYEFVLEGGGSPCAWPDSVHDGW